MKVHQAHYDPDRVSMAIFWPHCGIKLYPGLKMTLNKRVTCKRCLKKRKTAKGKR